MSFYLIKSLLGLILGVYIYTHTPVATPLRAEPPLEMPGVGEFDEDWRVATLFFGPPGIQSNV